jgi:hypothetical protein
MSNLGYIISLAQNYVSSVDLQCYAGEARQMFELS